MSELPKGWVDTTLGEVAAWGSGGTPKATNPRFYGGDIPWAVIGDLSDGKVSQTAASITEEGLDASSAKIVEPGTVLIAMYGSIGKLGVAGLHLATNQAIAFARACRGVLSSYLFWYLRGQRSALTRAGKGATQQNISQTILKSWPIHLAPTAEQERIVAAIEEQFSRLDAADEALHRARRNVERFRSSSLTVAFRGEWPLERIGDFATVGSGATPKRDRVDYYGGDVPWVTSGQLNGEFVREPAALITRKALAETSVRLWPKHTLLVAMYGEGQTRGRCSELLFESTTNQACAAIVPDPARVDRVYLKRFFAATYERNRRLASGGVQPNLSLGIIRDS